MFNTNIQKQRDPEYFSKFESLRIHKPDFLNYLSKQKGKKIIKIFFFSKKNMASWQNSSGKENHKSLFDNTSHDQVYYVQPGSNRNSTNRFHNYVSEFEYNTGSICKTCYHANAVKVKAV